MEQKQVDQGIRLKNLIKALNLNQSTFAQSLGMAQPNISKMMNGERQLSMEILDRMADRYNVNLHWLLTGVGAMFLDSVEHASPSLEKEPSNGKGKLAELKKIAKRLEETVSELQEKLGTIP